MRVTFVAAPLVARSGVYRSARELVNEGRRQGRDWHLFLGVSGRAAGGRPAEDPSWITEVELEPAGLGGVRRLARRLQANMAESDVVVSLIPQTDMALSLTDLPWVAYTRGLPWPGRGESGLMRTLLWRGIERTALRLARAVWATTPVLRDQLALRREVRVVPAGIRAMPRQWDGTGDRDTVVWAARFDEDKNPALLLAAMSGSGANAVMYGSGPLEARLRQDAPSTVLVAGWAEPDRLWDGALAYLGTSHREAFGRSAVEAAMSGIPIVIADSFGSAPLLYTDPALREQFVLPVDDASLWSVAIESLRTDETLRRRVSDHLVANAATLTVEFSARSVAAALQDLFPPSISDQPQHRFHARRVIEG